MKRLFISGLAVTLIFLGCQTKKQKENTENTPIPALQGELRISGADALYPLMKALATEFMKTQPDLTITVSGGGTGAGLQSLLEGQCDLAMVSRELTPDEESQDLWFFPVTKEGVVPVVNSQNPFLDQIIKHGIKRTDLVRLYSGETGLSWGQILSLEADDPVLLLTRSDASGAAAVWAQYLGLHESGLYGTGVDGDIGMKEKIMDEPLSLGYCNAHYVYDFMDMTMKGGISVIPLDINNNGRIDANESLRFDRCITSRIATPGNFPYHLCREISLVCRGKPADQNIIGFLRWIYTDGQMVTAENGYAGLKQCIAEDYLYLLDHTIFRE